MQFKNMIRSLEPETLSNLCEQFVYDHEGAIDASIQFASSYGLTVDSEKVKDFITEMHKNGDFDHVECWGSELGDNELYRKFHN